jgi:hypothetical protein
MTNTQQLDSLVEDLRKEVTRHNPHNLLEFCAEFFKRRLEEAKNVSGAHQSKTSFLLKCL